MSDRKKLNQTLFPSFKPDNEGWDRRESETISQITSEYEKEIISQEIEDEETPPHKKKIEDIVYDVRVVFFKVLELILDRENPIPYILSEKRNQFSFCIIIIVIGIMMLLISNILK